MGVKGGGRRRRRGCCKSTEHILFCDTNRRDNEKVTRDKKYLFKKTVYKSNLRVNSNLIRMKTFVGYTVFKKRAIFISFTVYNRCIKWGVGARCFEELNFLQFKRGVAVLIQYLLGHIHGYKYKLEHLPVVDMMHTYWL